MGSRSTLLALAVAAISIFLYARSPALWTYYNNAPGRLQKLNSFKNYEIKFADRVRSCEDVLLLEKQGLVLAACDPGRERWNTVMGIFKPGPVTSADLYIYNYKDVAASDAEALKKIKLIDFPAASDFHTLGMAYEDETSTLYVSNHAKAGPRIEVFKVDLEKATAKHTTTLQHPLINGPNSIVLINKDEFYVTNDHLIPARVSRIVAKLETISGLPLGKVVHVKLDKGAIASIQVVAKVPFANGVEILNSTTVAVASTSGAFVGLYSKNEDGTLKQQSRIAVPFLPDNLSVSGNKLIIAGHPHFPTLAQFTLSRHICNDPAEFAQADDKTKEYCSTGSAPSAVAEWSEKDGLKMLYVDTEYPSSATAARDEKRGVGIISGLYAKGLFVWRD